MAPTAEVAAGKLGNLCPTRMTSQKAGGCARPVRLPPSVLAVGITTVSIEPGAAWRLLGVATGSRGVRVYPRAVASAVQIAIDPGPSARATIDRERQAVTQNGSRSCSDAVSGVAGCAMSTSRPPFARFRYR